MASGGIEMSQAALEYAYKTPEGGWRVADSRVSLDSVVCLYWEGKSPEAIVEEFPTLSAEQVYGALAFYLRNRTEIDAYLARQEENWQRFAKQSKSQHGPLLDRLRERRHFDDEK
jgi:uncharacterized protein (DUF433 family)